MTSLRLFPVCLALCLGTINAPALGASKEELKLDYTVAIHEHKTGRITIVFTLKDEGRMKPLSSVDLSIPSKDGSGYFHLVTALKLSGKNGSRIGRIHIHKDWAKNANISLKTSHLDGKMALRTWYYHSIPIGGLLQKGK